MNHKELISQIKDYANIADASYAMLDLIDENDEKGFNSMLNIKTKFYLY
ncbi:diadenosine tetraphosphate hydrolase [Campylobacter peloridis]|uniref:Diadenosine tetraphosphate hydrolase n=1 Tax=Campylobacter peloridis TaxID=488546 RepID=A0A5C7DTJ0_9BACT|nr:diadenosine tetraphosphate hydrolase [Campylobacter peloridis]TXE78495.1 diadenosine tetraphosphate hydrolase [Campylobacter peloridis]